VLVHDRERRHGPGGLGRFVIRRIAPAYGLRASIRCSARRRRAAATNWSALVIFWMFLTAPIRSRTSR
jgi:hypothetical protein